MVCSLVFSGILSVDVEFISIENNDVNFVDGEICDMYFFLDFFKVFVSDDLEFVDSFNDDDDDDLLEILFYFLSLLLLLRVGIINFL